MLNRSGGCTGCEGSRCQVMKSVRFIYLIAKQVVNNIQVKLPTILDVGWTILNLNPENWKVAAWKMLNSNSYRVTFCNRIIKSFLNIWKSDWLIKQSVLTQPSENFTGWEFWILIVCSYQVTYPLESESTHYICLNVWELLAWNRREIWMVKSEIWWNLMVWILRAAFRKFYFFQVLQHFFSYGSVLLGAWGCWKANLVDFSKIYRDAYVMLLKLEIYADCVYTGNYKFIPIECESV